MRVLGPLLLLGLAACSGDPSAPAPCPFPMVIDSTGECVSGPRATQQFGPEQMFDRRR